MEDEGHENSYQDFRKVKNGSSKEVLKNQTIKNILLVNKVKVEQHLKA